MRRLEYMDRGKYAFGATRGGVNLWAAAQVKPWAVKLFREMRPCIFTK
jgi:hypothetical protein